MIEHTIAPLFVPATRIELVEKAATVTDCVIVDLEDAVAPSAKPEARAVLAGLTTDVVVRINDLRSDWFADDVAAMDSERIAAIILPKSESADDLNELRRRLGRDIAVVALVETARGLGKIGEIAESADRVAFGSLDYAADMGSAPDAESLLYARSQILLAARLANRPAPLDGITPNFRDQDACRADTAHAAKLGFGGRLCIHPSQVGLVREGFLPSIDDVNWAEKIIALRQDGAQSLDGEMIDAPVRLRAQNILRRAKL